MPTNVADTAQIAGVPESRDLKQLVKAVRTVATIDRSWHTIPLLGIAREIDADGERCDANVTIRDECRKSVVAAKTTSGRQTWARAFTNNWFSQSSGR